VSPVQLMSTAAPAIQHVPFHLCTQLFYKELSTFYYSTLLHHA